MGKTQTREKYENCKKNTNIKLNEGRKTIPQNEVKQATFSDAFCFVCNFHSLFYLFLFPKILLRLSVILVTLCFVWKLIHLRWSKKMNISFSNPNQTQNARRNKKKNMRENLTAVNIFQFFYLSLFFILYPKIMVLAARFRFYLFCSFSWCLFGFFSAFTNIMAKLVF